MAPKSGEPSLAADSRRRPAAWIVGWLRAAEGERSALKDHLSSRQITIVSNILGPQRLTVELPFTTIPVKTTPNVTGPGESLFAFKIDGNSVVGSIVETIGIVHRNGIEIATIEPVRVPTSKRLAFRTQSVIVGCLNYSDKKFPMSCTLWMGLIGTDFTLQDVTGRRIASWSRWSTRTKLLISANVSDELFQVILGLVVYTEVEKGSSC